MSEIKHSPEPWLATGNTLYALNEFGTNRFQACFGGGGKGSADEAEIQETVRRAAACVNACAGIPTGDPERWSAENAAKHMEGMEEGEGGIRAAISTLLGLVLMQESRVGVTAEMWATASETVSFLYPKPEGTDK